jgi:hypothetical protein
MDEQIKKILKMVEEGKINSEQASELIAALKDKEKGTAAEPQKTTPTNLRVKIISKEGKNVDLKVPVKFIKGIIKATGSLPINIEGKENIDMKVITEAIENDCCGKVFEMNTNAGEYIEVIID